MIESSEYVRALVAKRPVERRDDFTSNLLQARASEVASLIFRLLTADHETTTSLLANGFGRLLTERAGWEEICRDPVLILNAVEEIHEDGYVDSHLAKQNHGVNRNREHRGSP